jgi:hypothetical protein
MEMPEISTALVENVSYTEEHSADIVAITHRINVICLPLKWTQKIKQDLKKRTSSPFTHK